MRVEAAHGAADRARGRLEELVTSGLDRLRPDMLIVWVLALLARGCVVLGEARHAPRLYQAEEMAGADARHRTERASRLRAEKDFLVHELAAHLDQSVRTGARCSYVPSRC